VKDALGRTAAVQVYSVDGQVIRSESIDAGVRHALADIMGAPLYAWDAVGQRVRNEYDVLRRLTKVWVKAGDDSERLAERIVYG
jgi:insecticidal toxin complex protein TccC